MQDQPYQYHDELNHPVSSQTADKFNTLQAYSHQSTGLLETTLADTLGMSMHNAVSTQQQSQMTTAASITNACARLLQTQAKSSATSVNVPVEPAIVVTKEDKLGRYDQAPPQASQPAEPEKTDTKKSGRLSLFRYLMPKKKEQNE